MSLERYTNTLPLLDTTQTIRLSLSRLPERDACVAVTAGVRGFLGRSRVRGGLWAERIAPVISVVILLGGAYRALLFFRVELLAGRIAPVISVVVYWVERIAPVRVWVWRNW